MSKEKDIQERAEQSMNSRMEDLEFLYNSDSPEEWDNENWKIAEDFGITKDMTEDDIYEAIYTGRNEYGLSFDYVAPDTFNDQERGYFRYQISWGGPSEEIRFYVDYDKHPYKIEFWFLDWFTGHGIELEGDYLETAEAIFQDFSDMGSVDHAYDEAREE